MYFLCDDFGNLPLKPIYSFALAIKQARKRAHDWQRPITVVRSYKSWHVWPDGKIEKCH